MDERTVSLIILMAGVGIFSSPIFSLFVTPIFCFLRKIIFVPLVQNKILKKAIANGHMVTGRLQKKLISTNMMNMEVVQQTMKWEYMYTNTKVKHISFEPNPQQVYLMK